MKSWAGIERLLKSEDYVSMADVIDVSGLDPGKEGARTGH